MNMLTPSACTYSGPEYLGPVPVPSTVKLI